MSKFRDLRQMLRCMSNKKRVKQMFPWLILIKKNVKLMIGLQPSDVKKKRGCQ